MVCSNASSDNIMPPTAPPAHGLNPIAAGTAFIRRGVWILTWVLLLPGVLGCNGPRPGPTAGLIGRNDRIYRVAKAADWPADLLVMFPDPGRNDFHPPRFTELSLTDPYVVDRGGGNGGIHLMSEGGRTVRDFTIPRSEIHRIIRMRFDMDVIDTTDVVLCRRNITLVHTGYANGGVFRPSEVYVFPNAQNPFDYLRMIENNVATNGWKGDELKLLFPALLFDATQTRHRASDGAAD